MNLVVMYVCVYEHIGTLVLLQSGGDVATPAPGRTAKVTLRCGASYLKSVAENELVTQRRQSVQGRTGQNAGECNYGGGYGWERVERRRQQHFINHMWRLNSRTCGSNGNTYFVLQHSRVVARTCSPQIYRFLYSTLKRVGTKS